MSVIVHLLENIVRTITLDGIVSNPTQHCELGGFAQQEAVAHPGEEMREAVMASPDALWDTGASTSEGKRTDAVRSQYDIGIRFSETHLRRQNIDSIDCAPEYLAGRCKIKRGYLHADFEFSR